MSDSSTLAALSDRTGWAASRQGAWARIYTRQAMVADFCTATVAAIAAVGVRFGGNPNGRYIILSFALPVIWLITLRVFGGYERRSLGVGSDESRRVLNAGLSLTGALALSSYALNDELSRVYLVVSMPIIVVLDPVGRLVLRKRLHRLPRAGRCMSTVVAVGHESAVRQLISELRREPRHGLQVIAACLAGEYSVSEVADVPIVGDLDVVGSVVRNLNADTVAVLSCPEMDGVKLRTLAWELEKTRTDLCLAPALLDVAGPRTTIRPTAGLTLLHVDHPQLSGPRQVLQWPVAGKRQVQSVVGRVRAAGSPIRGELVPSARPSDPVEDHQCHTPQIGRLLGLASDCRRQRGSR